jgi:hypothetical protein
VVWRIQPIGRITAASLFFGELTRVLIRMFISFLAMQAPGHAKRFLSTHRVGLQKDFGT